jgi:hypothetical protein
MMTNRFAFFECRPRVRLKEVLILSLLLCASALTVPANAQQPTIITFDVPGAGTAPGQGTFGIAVNPEGAIAGYYFDVNYAVHGFVRGSNGAITEFDAAGAGTAGGQGTAPLSYNPAGAITGFSIDVNYAHHGFLRAPDGAVTTFDVLGAGTGAGQGTEARNINPEGAIAGRYYDASDVVHGFVRAPNGAITTFDVAGAGTGFHQGTESCGLDCITPEGVIAGNYYDASGVQHGMVRANDGTITTFDVPGAGTGAGQGTHTAGINPAGEIEGHYVDARGVSHGFLRTSDGAITTFDASGAGTASGQGTTPSNINPDGATPGSYIDANNVLHGFVRDQEGEITKFDVPGAGTAAFQGTFPISNNPANSITGWYTDASGVSHGFLRRGSKTIAQIQITGEPVIVFDHRTDQQQPLNIPDDQITAWREADGTVNLLIPHYEAYRMRGPNLLHLTIDPNEIYSSTQSGSQIPENLYNYHHWLSGPYSLDGRTFYSLAHSEWYACLLNGDCDQIGANGLSATLNSWANTINSFVSADGGASWHLNAVNNNHVVAQTAFYWTGSVALADKIYLEALNHSGMFQPTRVIKEGSFYYAIGYYIHRDFSRIDPAHGVYQAPIDKTGYALIRTNDITNPNGWQAWTGGGSYQSFPTQNIAVFLPQQNGSTLNAAPPQLVFDTNVQCYILIHTLYGGSNAVNYMTTRSLANPSWSQSTPILGTAQLITDPGGPV